MSRTSQHTVRTVFERLAKALGKSTITYTKIEDGSYTSIEGAWDLDYAGMYGGYTITEMQKHGGEYRPFGNERHPAGEFVAMMNFALNCLTIQTEFHSRRPRIEWEKEPVETWEQRQARILDHNTRVMNRLCSPHTPAEVCEGVAETDE